MPEHSEDSYPLSPMQQGMLFHSLFAPQSGLYIEQLICSLHECLDVPAFERAWRRIVERHPVLRTSFHWEDGREPLQEVHRHVGAPWEYLDLRGLTTRRQKSRLETFLEADRRRGFNLTEAPLMRLALFRWAETDYRFVWTFHHALLDGRSSMLVLKELFACYEAFRRCQDVNLPPTRPFRRYIDWLENQDLRKVEQFWRRALNGFTAATPLVVDHTHRAVLDEEGYGTRTIRLSRTLTSGLQSLAREHQLTPNTLLHGAWALLLNRYSGEEQVVFGATKSVRPAVLEGAESMVGLFINTLPIRVHLSTEMSLLPWVKELRSQWIGIREYEHAPLTKAHGWSDIPPGEPLFESILIFENYLLNSALRAQGGSWKSREFQLLGPANYPITVTGYLDQELLLEIGYDRRRFDEDTVGRMLEHLQTLIKGIVAGPERRLRELPILTEREHRELLVEWNDTATEYPREECIHQLFEAQVKRAPNAVAVVFEGAQLTYRELNRRANQLAHHLRKLGAGPEVLVGICMERSLEMVVGLLAVLKAGGAYVPLDPSYPEERLAFMLHETHAPILLTQRKFLDYLPGHRAQVICLDSDWEIIAGEDTGNHASGVKAENLAYVIFTSGSTGKPKGVMVCHRGVCSFLHWRCAYFPLKDTDRMLQKASLSFDDSVWEIFEPLIVGAQLIMAPPGSHQDSALLVRLISEQNITAVSFVPSMLQAFLEEPGVEKCNSLRRVTTGGEVLPMELQERFFDRLDADLYNGYGPTETTIAATFWTCTRGKNQNTVPIGHPVANTQIYLLDAHLRLVPIGVPGELYIGGIGLARGYLNQPSLTAARFIPHPFSVEPGARLYRTGDLARYRPHGDLEFLGRIDHQVKIRGFRIELGEIEAALLHCPAVREAVLIVREDIPREKRLVAYVVCAPNRKSSASDLRSFLGKKLPEYMIPSTFKFLDRLPLSPSGKVDRAALSDRVELEPDKDFLGPRDALERRLVAIWEELLGVKPIGVTDNFFALGGHSLLIARLLSRIEKTLGQRLPLVTLFQAPNIEALAAVLRKEGEPASSTLLSIRAGSNQPFFMIHGSWAIPFLKQSLAADQPLYYLPSYWDGVDLPRHSRIEDMAVCDLQEVRRVQPRGPYFLGGYSIGGVLAFEMARQLQQQGSEVALLCLLAPTLLRSSSLPPKFPGDSPRTALLPRLSSAMARSRARFMSLEPPERPKFLREKAGNFFKMIEEALERRTKRVFCRAYQLYGHPPPEGLRPFVREEVNRTYSRAAEEYTPTPMAFSGRMVLFMDENQGSEDLSCWRDLVVGELEIHHIPAKHLDIAKEPHVHIWIEQLKLCLKKAHLSIGGGIHRPGGQENNARSR